jgi:hypothetical protein
LHHKQREAEGKSIRSVALSHKKYVHQDSISKTDPN